MSASKTIDNKAHAEELDRMADRGELHPVPGTKIHRGYDAEPLTEDDLLDIFQGRPRAVFKQPAAKTWKPISRI